MRKMIQPLFVSLLVLACFFKADAQISVEAIKSQMLKDWERAKAYTGEYLQAMPTDKYSLKATDSVRSFSQQMLHLAQANMFFAATASGSKSPYQGFNIEASKTAQTKDSVTYYVNASYDFVISNLKNLSDAQFGENVKAFGQDIARSVLFLKAFEHQTHHRGQATIYIRLAGIRPPGEKLF